MSEKPILFSGEMVRAVLDGRKTQTRRIIKVPRWATGGGVECDAVHPSWPIAEDCYGDHHGITCPYGATGDRLWVRETWRTMRIQDGIPPRYVAPGSTVYYEADQRTVAGEGKGRPSIFMPRWASRITLEVTGVRVERVQDISEGDAQAEGCVGKRQVVHIEPTATHRSMFAALWDSINGNRKDKHGNRLPYAWSDNPWVWVIEFEKGGAE